MKFKIVLTGGPHSGKTTTLNALIEMPNREHLHFIKEQTTEYNNAKVKADPEFKPFADLITLNREVTKMQIEEEDKEADENCVLDRSLIDDIAISRLLKVGVAEGLHIPEEIEEIMKDRKPYDMAFILARINVETGDKTIRNAKENPDEQHDALIAEYSRYIPKENVIIVPVMPVMDRVKFIADTMKAFMEKSLAAEKALAAEKPYTSLFSSCCGFFSQKTPAAQVKAESKTLRM